MDQLTTESWAWLLWLLQTLPSNQPFWLNSQHMQVPSVTQLLDHFCKDDTEQELITGLDKIQTAFWIWNQNLNYSCCQFQFHSFKE